MTDLKPCPFCGGDAIIERDFSPSDKPANDHEWAECKTCGATGPWHRVSSCDDSDGEYGIESAIERCRLLKGWGTNPWVMLNIDRTPTKAMRHLKRWANQKQIFWSIDISEYK